MSKDEPASALSSTIVIKLGTTSIVHETTHQPLLSTLSSIVETVLRLKGEGHKVVLVSSGAIGVGLKRMNIGARPKSLAGTQALAAIGQGRLIALWDNLFGQLGQPIAQVLLTRGDIADRTRHTNAANTLSELLSMGVVPIVNENDTVSVSEIKFGDNDTLSAITASMVHADYLFLLTDVDGLYTANPRKDPTAKAIEIVPSVPQIRSQVSTNTLGSKLGTGGMETKLIAAEIATAAGVTTVISSSKHPERIFEIIEYNAMLRNASAPSTPPPAESSSANSDESESPRDEQQRTPIPPSATLNIPRPPHTLFTPSMAPLRDLKWTSHSLTPAGSVVIDAHAHLVLSRHYSGGRLLPAGVLGVTGTFASGQAVRLVVRRRERDGSLAAAQEEARVAGGSYASGTNGYSYGGSPPFFTTEPGTPTLLPAASMTSSISTMEHLPRRFSADMTPSPSASAGAANSIHGQIGTIWEDDQHAVAAIEKEDDDLAEEGWEMFEVGMGLANYNSAQIRRVKGMKSSNIPHVLAYADSEYVVEHITIRVPP